MSIIFHRQNFRRSSFIFLCFLVVCQKCRDSGSFHVFSCFIIFLYISVLVPTTTTTTTLHECNKINIRFCFSRAPRFRGPQVRGWYPSGPSAVLWVCVVVPLLRPIVFFYVFFHFLIFSSIHCFSLCFFGWYRRRRENFS